MHVWKQFAYVLSDEDALTIIDVSDPTKPRLASQISDGDCDDQGRIMNRLDRARSVYVSGGLAYVASEVDNSLTIIDVSDPIEPRLAAQISDGDSDGEGKTFDRLEGAFAAFVAGDLVYVASFTDDS